MSTRQNIFGFVILLTFLNGCSSSRINNLQDQNTSRLTVGVVQKEIKIGMSGSDVLTVLGSPNIVSSDSKRREVWVYDKISTSIISNSASGFVFAGIVGGQDRSSSSRSSQRTLTIIIKFDEQGAVRDYTYHSSSF